MISREELKNYKFFRLNLISATSIREAYENWEKKVAKATALDFLNIKPCYIFMAKQSGNLAEAFQ